MGIGRIRSLAQSCAGGSRASVRPADVDRASGEATCDARDDAHGVEFVREPYSAEQAGEERA